MEIKNYVRMILIADSGSTKTEWQVLGESGLHFYTQGINPYYQNEIDIMTMLGKEMPLAVLPSVSRIYFYGAGCNNDEMKNLVKSVLLKIFREAEIKIESDLLGAARSLCQHEAGIACILGTGSNSCFYDGKKIKQNISPLGFIIGDDGSGAVLGKRFISDLLKNQLPPKVKTAFFKTYKYTPADIVTAVYRESFPNRFLAQFSRFIVTQLHVPEVEALVFDEFHRFFKRNVLQYPSCKEVPIHFVGSVAHHYESQLSKVMNTLDLNLGNIYQVPMKELLNYHS